MPASKCGMDRRLAKIGSALSSSTAVVTADRERFRVEAGAESHGQDAAAGRARHR